VVKKYAKPDCSVIEMDMTEAINLGVGTNAAGEESQLSKKNVFIEDPSEEESWGENPFGHGSFMDDSFVNVKWND
jgi:hypothetical protein